MYRPRRRSPDLPAALTFGGRVPAAVGLLLVAIGLVSLASWAMRGDSWAALESGRTLAQPWRLVTYSLAQMGPIDLVFGLIAVYFFGPPLVQELGERRFLGTVLAISVGAGLITLLIAWALGAPVRYAGVWPVVDGLVLAWALRYPEQQVLLMFVVPVTGRVMGLVTVGITGVLALYALVMFGLVGLVAYVPLLAALGVAWLLSGARIGLPRRWRLGMREWRLERQLRRRSRHLKVVRKDGHDGPPQWLN